MNLTYDNPDNLEKNLPVALKEPSKGNNIPVHVDVGLQQSLSVGTSQPAVNTIIPDKV